MSNNTNLTELAAESLRFSTQRRMVRLDDSSEEVEQTYLAVEGTVEGFRWLSKHLAWMAHSVEEHLNGCGNVVAARDFKNRPIKMEAGIR